MTPAPLSVIIARVSTTPSGSMAPSTEIVSGVPMNRWVRVIG